MKSALLISTALLAFVAAPCHAQSGPITPTEFALGNKLFAEINSGVTCATGSEIIRRQLEESRAEVKQLKAQIDAKKDAGSDGGAKPAVTAPQ